jgi:predicted RNase H-like nuclease (RuvC/YqgF family)
MKKKLKNKKSLIKNLTSEVEDAQKEISFLKRKLDQKYDIIADLERELDKFDDLEKEIRATQENTSWSRHSYDSNAAQIVSNWQTNI